MHIRLGYIFRFAVCVCALAAGTRTHAIDQQTQIQDIVDDLRARLSITAPVQVAIVAANPKLFSIAPAEQAGGTFLLSVEKDFALGLNDAELHAAVAHELGHVWIFTHFPYLQTEELANDIAARVVSRESLAPLYEKVWKKAAAD